MQISDSWICKVVTTNNFPFKELILQSTQREEARMGGNKSHLKQVGSTKKACEKIAGCGTLDLIQAS